MKTIRISSGPFQKRPHFRPEEIDRICEDALKKAGFYPTAPQPIRVDRFIEKRFGAPPDYEDLPQGVLGYTRFAKNGVDRIVIAKSLAEDDSDVARRRERTTMAHEAGHGLLHAYLFALETPATTLFGTNELSGTQILCREVIADGLGYRPKSSWSEFQANRAISGLLLPRKLVAMALRPYLTSAGMLGGTTLDPARRKAAEVTLSDTFDVNPIVVRILLDELFSPESNGQLPL
jgi:hypothetical protein